MPLDERSRITFHAWLVDHDLDDEVASAILGVMPPFDWHEIPKKADLDRRFDEVDRRFSHIDSQFAKIDSQFSKIDSQFAKIDSQFSKIDSRSSKIHDRFDSQTDVLCRRMDEGFRDLRVEMAGMRKEMRTILLALVGFMLSVALGVMTTGLALAAG